MHLASPTSSWLGQNATLMCLIQACWRENVMRMACFYGEKYRMISTEYKANKDMMRSIPIFSIELTKCHAFVKNNVFLYSEIIA